MLQRKIHHPSLLFRYLKIVLNLLGLVHKNKYARKYIKKKKKKKEIAIRITKITC
jgi:hypothetical protein